MNPIFALLLKFGCLKYLLCSLNEIWLIQIKFQIWVIKNVQILWEGYTIWIHLLILLTLISKQVISRQTFINLYILVNHFTCQSRWIFGRKFAVPAIVGKWLCGGVLCFSSQGDLLCVETDRDWKGHLFFLVSSMQHLTHSWNF